MSATTKIVVDGVELTVEQTVEQEGGRVRISRVTGRDRKRKIDITSVEEFHPAHPAAITIANTLKRVAKMATARCTCDYGRGWSDHAESCQSIYVADREEWIDDDD